MLLRLRQEMQEVLRSQLTSRRPLGLPATRLSLTVPPPKTRAPKIPLLTAVFVGGTPRVLAQQREALRRWGERKRAPVLAAADRADGAGVGDRPRRRRLVARSERRALCACFGAKRGRTGRALS